MSTFLYSFCWGVFYKNVGILLGSFLTVKKFEEEIFFRAEEEKGWKTCKKVVNLFTWCLHKTPKNRLVYISLHRIKINKIPISNWYCCVGSVAQLVEHLTFNQVVRGSRPRRPTSITKGLLVCHFFKSPFVCIFVCIQPYKFLDMVAPVSKVSSPERCA